MVQKLAKFDMIVAGYMRRLINDLGITLLDSAAVFGNGGHESNGFQTLQEIKPTVKGSAGGYGWFQWTGPRRRAFIAFCKSRGLQPHDDEANYQFLVHELRTNERGALNKMAVEKTLYKKVEAFELAYERAGVKHYPSRKAWAMRAIRAYDRANTPVTDGKVPAPSVPELLAQERLPEPEEVPLPEPASEPTQQTETKPMESKSFLFSKRFWGALITLLSTTGLLSIGGITIDTDTWTITIVLPTLASKLVATGVPGGALLSMWGGFVAKHILRLR